MDELASSRIHPATVELASSWIHPATEELPPGSIRRLPWTTGADYEHRREEEEDTGKNICEYSFLRVRFVGSDSSAARADPQSRFFGNCIRNLQVGIIRGVLEML